VENLSDICVQNFLGNVTVKNFCKSVPITYRSYDEKSSVLFFKHIVCARVILFQTLGFTILRFALRRRCCQPRATVTSPVVEYVERLILFYDT